MNYINSGWNFQLPSRYPWYHHLGDNDVCCGKENFLYVQILDKYTWFIIILKIFFCIDAKEKLLKWLCSGSSDISSFHWTIEYYFTGTYNIGIYQLKTWKSLLIHGLKHFLLLILSTFLLGQAGFNKRMFSVNIYTAYLCSIPHPLPWQHPCPRPWTVFDLRGQWLQTHCTELQVYCFLNKWKKK